MRNKNFRKLTEHLLDVHVFTNIWCITGPQGNHQSENRLLGYRDALISHGIDPRTEWEFYGDFWRDHAKDIADRIADGILPRPQATACAGTIPAVSLIEQLSEHGIRVPEDIAVTGYDCFLEGEICSPAVTYVSSPDYNQGVQIMCRLHKMLTWYYGIGYKYYSMGSDGYYNAANAQSKSAKGEATRWGSAVGLKDSADYFRAEYITFENSFNRYVTDEEIADGVEPSGSQSITFQRKKGVDVTSKTATERAAAIAVEGDYSEFLGCTFLGSQDTLFTKCEHGYFRECHI